MSLTTSVDNRDYFNIYKNRYYSCQVGARFPVEKSFKDIQKKIKKSKPTHYNKANRYAQNLEVGVH